MSDISLDLQEIFLTSHKDLELIVSHPGFDAVSILWLLGCGEGDCIKPGAAQFPRISNPDHWRPLFAHNYNRGKNSPAPVKVNQNLRFFSSRKVLSPNFERMRLDGTSW
jgi:hypothetical protein